MNIERLESGRMLLMVSGVAASLVITPWMLSVMAGAVLVAAGLSFLFGLLINVVLICLFNPVARILDLRGWHLAVWTVLPPATGVLMTLLPELGF